MSSLKGVFKNSSFLSQLFLLLGLTLFLSAVSSFLSIAVVFVKGSISLHGADLQSVMTHIYGEASSLRIIQFITSLGTFFFPPVLLAYLFSDSRDRYLYLGKKVRPSIYVLSVLGIIVSVPFLNLLVSLCANFHLPGFLGSWETWLKNSEASNQQLIENMLRTSNYGDLALNVVVICFIAALGEEFFFRGLLQRILGKIIRNEHIIIWVTAIIFSAVHMEYSGFLGRVLLGGFLGYLLLYSRSIWVPVTAHFANNAFGVMTDFFLRNTPYKDFADRLGTQDTWWLAFVSLFLWGTLFVLIKKKSSL